MTLLIRIWLLEEMAAWGVHIEKCILVLALQAPCDALYFHQNNCTHLLGVGIKKKKEGNERRMKSKEREKREGGRENSVRTWLMYSSFIVCLLLMGRIPFSPKNFLLSIREHLSTHHSWGLHLTCLAPQPLQMNILLLPVAERPCGPGLAYSRVGSPLLCRTQKSQRQLPMVRRTERGVHT